MYQEKIVNIETDEITFRDYSADEIAQVEKAKADAEAALNEANKKEAAKKAILEKLGLTEEEAAVLLG